MFKGNRGKKMEIEKSMWLENGNTRTTYTEICEFNSRNYISDQIFDLRFKILIFSCIT